MSVGDTIYALMAVHPDGKRAIFGISHNLSVLPLPLVVTDRVIFDRALGRAKPAMREAIKKGIVARFEVSVYGAEHSEKVEL